ncbi:MAG TPA: cation:proton antiporter [Gammaproteobacteria bacterium]|nr:cation:proton antiporter [Gammaproteobacteria bacterium]
MTDYPALIFAAAMIFVYGLFSRAADRSLLTAPMFFVAIGTLAGPAGLNLFQIKTDLDAVHVLTEVTLVLVLFVDASTINLKKLLAERTIPLRLLLIGLPLTMLLGTLLAWPLYPGVDIWLLLLMALILSPTDAALGQAVILSKEVPERVRRWISVESGLNDGIALPPIFACIAVLSPGTSAADTHWSLFLLQQILLGGIVGGAVGWIGGYLVSHASARDWMNHSFQQLVSGSLAVLCFALAETLHGNGFIAAFAGGLMLGADIHSTRLRERIQEFGEAFGQQLVLFVFLIFAMAMVPVSMPYWDLTAWIYALLSLSVIRLLPVAISLFGSRLDLATVLFIGWFGPRGIASVLYLLLIVHHLGFDGYERILSVIVLTVLLSVFLHGATAVPLSRRYAARTRDGG